MCEVSFRVVPAKKLGNYVFNLQPGVEGLLGSATVFTSVPSPLGHHPVVGIHLRTVEHRVSTSSGRHEFLSRKCFQLRLLTWRQSFARVPCDSPAGH
jgi:hypothetical protein